MASLTIQLMEMLANSSALEETKAVFVRAIEEVAGSGVAPGLDLGTTMPAFILPDAFGQLVSSSQLLEKGPLVVSFYRGEWCPYCNLELRALETAAEQIKSLGASIVAISGQRPENAKSLTEKHSLSFPVLSDIDQEVIRAFKLQYPVPAELRRLFEERGNEVNKQNADGSWTLPISATYVSASDGLIALNHVAADWRTRLDPVDITKALAQLVA